MMFKRSKEKESGLTLVELIVAIGLFGILSVFVTGAFLNILSMQTQAEKKQQIVNDFRVALDLMGKEIAAGEGFPDEPSGVHFLYFSTKVRPDMIRRGVQYDLQSGRIMKAQQDTQSECNVAATGGGSYGLFPSECFVPFTSEDIYIEDLTFYIQNFDPSNTYGHPLVTITASGYVDLLDSNPSFQTSVSYSPRSNISPDDRPPTDTTSPELEILIPPNDTTTDQSVHDIEGDVRDPGGSGIERVRIQVYRGGWSGLMTHSDVTTDSFVAGSSGWFSWDFEDVPLSVAGEENYIRVTAFDHSGNTAVDTVIIESTAPPEDPAPPEIISAEYRCSTDSMEVDRVVIEIDGNESAGDFDKYEIERNGVVIGDMSATDSEYIDASVVDDESYTYRVRSVNTTWTPNPKSSFSDPETVNIPATACELSPPQSISANIECTSSDAPSIEGETTSSWEDRYGEFEVSGTDDAGGESWSGGVNSPSFTWTHSETGGLTTGTYGYRSRICLGGLCTGYKTLSDPLEIDANTCVPANADIIDVNPPTRPICSVFPDGPNAGDPAIAMNIGVKTGSPIPETRNFDEFIVQECSDASCISVISEETCSKPSDDFERLNCAQFFYDRVDGTYYYRVKSHNTSTGETGANSSVYTYTIDGDMCIPMEPTDYFLTMDAELHCIDDVANDYRRIDIGVNDNNKDITSTYRIYWCDDDPSTCETPYIDECSWADRDICASHYGPSDDQLHYYGVQICSMDGTCSGIYTPGGSSYDPVGVSNEECYPETAEIEDHSITPDIDCSSPGTDTRDVELYASASDVSGAGTVYIDIYRDGSLIADELSEFEVFTDTVDTEESYVYEFQACNPLATPSCGSTVSESYFVGSNICDPTTPLDIDFTVGCNDMGQITDVEVLALGSNYHNGYEIWRYDPSDTSFSCQYDIGDYDPSDCTDPLSSTITIGSSQQYSYKAISYRDGLTSSEKDESINLDPEIYCEAPFDVDTNPGFINVTITASGFGTRSSNSALIEVNPNDGFTETVYFDENEIEINLKDVMIDAGIDEDDITLYLSKNTSDHPYDNGPTFYVEIPDKDYLGEKESDIGAEFVIWGSAAGFDSKTIVPLLIEWDEGTVE